MTKKKEAETKRGTTVSKIKHKNRTGAKIAKTVAKC